MTTSNAPSPSRTSSPELVPAAPPGLARKSVGWTNISCPSMPQEFRPSGQAVPKQLGKKELASVGISSSNPNGYETSLCYEDSGSNDLVFTLSMLTVDPTSMISEHHQEPGQQEAAEPLSERSQEPAAPFSERPANPVRAASLDVGSPEQPEEAAEISSERLANPARSESPDDVDVGLDEVLTVPIQRRADELFEPLKPPRRPELLQESRHFFVAETREEVYDAVYFMLWQLCGSDNNVDPTTGKYMDCMIPPPTHLLPRWLSYNGARLFVRYRLSDEVERADKVHHLLQGSDNDQISHLCHTWQCLNPNHVVMENGEQNMSRNSCGPHRSCKHEPKCVIVGSRLFQQRTHDIVSAARGTRRVDDEIFPRFDAPQPANLQPKAAYLRFGSVTELREILDFWILRLAGNSDQVAADSGKHMECKSPPVNHLLPPWLMNVSQRLYVRYKIGAELGMARFMHMRLLYGTPEFEFREELQISHLCHRWWCMNPMHVLMEDNSTNVKRNSCGPTEYCDHKVKCAIAGGIFFRQQTALRRYNYDYQGGPLECNFPGCSKMLDNVNHLERHLRSCWKVKDFDCPHCEDKFSDVVQVKQHCQFKHSNYRPFPCASCDTAPFKTKGNLDAHIARFHSSGRKKFRCEVCLRTYEDKWSLKRHAEVHEDPDSLKCPKCSKQLRSQEGFERHMATQHIGKECCGFIFDTEAEYNMHLLMHDGKPFCKVCGTSKSREALVRKHFEYMHPELCPHKCMEKDCSKAFLKKKSLDNHFLKMHASRDFVCDCGKTFPNQSDMKTHQRKVHPDPAEYPVVCRYCQERFSSTRYRNGHINQIHLPKNFFCRAEICDIPFRSTKLRDGHEKAMHGRVY